MKKNGHAKSLSSVVVSKSSQGNVLKLANTKSSVQLLADAFRILEKAK